MEISTKVITNCNEVTEVESKWNRALEISGENPFLYSRLVSNEMSYASNRGGSPLVLTFWVEDRLVGLVPLAIQKMFHVKYVCNLSNVVYSDFVISKEYREECITQMVEFLFNRLKFRIIAITFQSESNLKTLEKVCRQKGLHLLKAPIMGRTIIQVESEWEQFYSSLKGKVRKEFRRRQHKLSELGTWKIYGDELNSKSIDRIFAIEKVSWKNNLREQNGEQKEDELYNFLTAAKANAKIEPIYKPEVWFLEVKGQAIAYLLVFNYNGTAFFVKTSYNSKFKKYAPGNFLSKEITHNIFKKKNVNKIDFITNLPGDKIWNPTIKKRTTVIVGSNSILISVLRFIHKHFRQRLGKLQY
ncbi:MAG: GNAT family N-acetyltransferase [Candidatus Bathyarchaeota archaeon]|nr:GNAT family N-acetyltransferase [Candidatus Bathyarchaeum sp.]